jgi:hypothetical protein
VKHWDLYERIDLEIKTRDENYSTGPVHAFKVKC